jgi:hypothetical protein
MTFNRAESATRNFPRREIARNPLKRLISDERIQGNPSFSNPRIEGFRAKKASNQENPTQPATARARAAEMAG